MTLMLLPDLPKGVRPLVKPIVDTADAAFVMSLDCQFLAWGSRAQQLFGFSPPDVLGRYCYDVLPARDASGQCLCSVNCPMVVAARYGYSVPPSEACIRTKQNRAIWVRLSPIVLRAPHGAICAILVLATDVSRYKLTEQLVRWIASRLDAGDDSSTFAVGDAATKLRTRFPDLANGNRKCCGKRSLARATTRSPRRWHAADDGAQPSSTHPHQTGRALTTTSRPQGSSGSCNATDGIPSCTINVAILLGRVRNISRHVPTFFGRAVCLSEELV
jgi:hypothetical protein